MTAGALLNIIVVKVFRTFEFDIVAILVCERYRLINISFKTVEKSLVVSSFSVCVIEAVHISMRYVFNADNYYLQSLYSSRNTRRKYV